MNAEFNEMQLKLTLYCLGQDWSGGCFRLEVEFASGGDGELMGVMRMTQFNLDWSFRFICAGYDLESFVTELMLLNEGKRSEARFVNQEESLHLCLEAMPSPNKPLIITGQVKSIAPDFTFKVPFGGFRSEASLVPEMVRCIREFLTVTNVTTVHPMTLHS